MNDIDMEICRICEKPIEVVQVATVKDGKPICDDCAKEQDIASWIDPTPNPMKVMLMQVFLNDLIRSLEDGKVDEVIAKLKRSLDRIEANG